MGCAGRHFKKLTNPLVNRYKQWEHKRREEDDNWTEFIETHKHDRAALERAGVIPPAQKPIYHAKEYYESRGRRDDLFLEKVLYDKKRWF